MRTLRHCRRSQQADRQAFKGLPAACRTRAGDHSQPRRSDSGRADLRPRSRSRFIETRDLIRGLAGDHTIILSTHILPEVEQICEQVIIISKGKVVATDTVENLTNRLRGSESIAVEVEPRSGAISMPPLCSSGWSRSPASAACCPANRASGRLLFEVESLQGRSIRGDLARAVVDSGWNLNELRPVAMSLEEVFLQLTSRTAVAEEVANE